MEAGHLGLPGREGAPLRLHEYRASLLRDAQPLLRHFGQTRRKLENLGKCEESVAHMKDFAGFPALRRKVPL